MPYHYYPSIVAREETVRKNVLDMSIDIQPLTPDRFSDLAALFEEGGDPKWCWFNWQVGHRAGSRPHSRIEDECMTQNDNAELDRALSPPPDSFADLAALFDEGGDAEWCWC